MEANKATGIAFFFNAETKELINKISVAKSSEEIASAMETAPSVTLWPVFVLYLVIGGLPLFVYPQACCSGGVPLGGSLGLGTQLTISYRLTAAILYTIASKENHVINP
jgi:hypothetical protein